MSSVRRGRRRAWAVLLTVSLSLSAAVETASAAITKCGPSGGYTLCVTVDSPDNTLTGNVTVSATISGGTGAKSIRWEWGEYHLLQDFTSPYSFTWPTRKYANLTRTLYARVVKSSTIAERVAVGTFSTQNAGAPDRNDTTTSVFQPDPPGAQPLIAAVGDGADGGSRSAAVAASIPSRSPAPTLLLYLGDVYERGSYAEFADYYGTADYDAADGIGTLWGTMASYTASTLGNHELRNRAAWQDYFHLPSTRKWWSFDYGGVHFVNLNSECSSSFVGGCGTSSAQYAWLVADLAANDLECVVASSHRAVMTTSSTSDPLKPMWALLANNGSDLWLSGHAHDMEIYRPMDASLQTGQADSHMVQVVSGAGGHNLLQATNTRPQLEWQAKKVPGALFITAVDGGTGEATSLDFRFENTSHAVVWSGGAPGTGSVACDSTTPTTPGKPSGSAASGTQIDLSWAASTDPDDDTLTYRIYRDSGGGYALVDTITGASSGTVLYSDTSVSPATTYSYRVAATDGTNTSSLSEASDPITTPDSTTPTTPGKPSGSAVSGTEIDLSWAASSDPDDASLTYRVYRDDGSGYVFVGDVTSDSTTTVGLLDNSGIAAGGTYTYKVEATDGTNTSSLSEPSDPITTPSS